MTRASRIVLYIAILLVPFGFVATRVIVPVHASTPPLCSTTSLNTANCSIDATQSLTFSPQFVTVLRFVTITWINTSTGIPHTTTSDPGDVGDSWDSGTLNPNQTFNHQFKVTGTFGYHCSFHGSPGKNMFGTITVVATKLSIKPSSGAHGSMATVTGSNYGAGETVTIKWNCATRNCTSTTILATPVANSNGSFSTKVQIPTNATPNTYPIGGKGGTTTTFAVTHFKVTS